MMNDLTWLMGYGADFFAGAFLCNCVPHLVAGFQGVPFPSPFARPRGIGDSSPLVNVLWGTFNLLVGILLLTRNPVTPFFHVSFGALTLGFVTLGIFTSLHFGKVQRDRLGKPQTDTIKI